MELRRLVFCIAVVVLAVVSHSTEARHAIRRRGAGDVNYDDSVLADEAGDDEAQNDDGGNEDDEDAVVNGTILTTADHYIVNVGKAVQLECKVSPSEGVVVSWSKDTENYFLGSTRMKASATRYSIARGSNDLLIEDLRPEDSGRYKCEIMQKVPISIEHTVSVVEAPRIIRFSTPTNPLKEGENLMLTCDATGSPKPEILWARQSKDGGTQKLTEKDGEFSSNMFFAKNITREMAGRYFCYALNSVNSSQMQIDIGVIIKPRVHVHRTIINSDIGVGALLQCTAHDALTTQIHWFKDNKPIEESSVEYSISTHETASNLTVTPRSDRDFGTYTCEGTSQHGSHSRSVEVVQGPVVEDFDVDGPKLTWSVHSHQPLKRMELQLRSISGDGEWRTIEVPVPSEKKREYFMVYVLGANQIEAGKYEAIVKVQNEKSWNPHSEPVVIDIETQAQPIQTASVFRSSTTGNAHSIRPTTTAVLSTILMYLLVRML